MIGGIIMNKKEALKLQVGDIVMPRNYHGNSTNQFECKVIALDGFTRDGWYHVVAQIEPLNPNDKLIRDKYKQDNWYSASALIFIRSGKIKVKVKRVK